MQAHEVLRAAADVVRAGWSPGGVAARDAQDNEVHLFGHAIGGSSRVAINPAAVKFSAYGALTKVLSRPGAGAVATGPLWQRLSEAARAKSPSRPGGTNYVHPLVQFNADPERTAGDVIELLTETADAMEREAAALQAGRAT